MLYRTCDFCVTEMENFKIAQMHFEARKDQISKMACFNEQVAILNADMNRQDLSLMEDVKQLKEMIYQKYQILTSLKSQETEVKKEIENNKVAKQYLKSNIADFHTVLNHLEYEQKR